MAVPNCIISQMIIHDGCGVKGEWLATPSTPPGSGSAPAGPGSVSYTPTELLATMHSTLI